MIILTVLTRLVSFFFLSPNIENLVRASSDSLLASERVKKCFLFINIFTSFVSDGEDLLVTHAAQAIKDAIHHQFVDQFVCFCDKISGIKFYDHNF